MGTPSNDELNRVMTDAEAAVEQIANADGDAIEQLRINWLGRKAGRLTAALRSVGALPPAERGPAGARLNAIKQQLTEAFATREAALASAGGSAEDVDWSMPGRRQWRGAVHPVNLVVDEICEIFREIGFTRVTGPEAETEEYNFSRLNIPLDHPAADMHDTFYLGKGILLRTHTSPMQARTMERYEPPIRIVVPGQAYRRDPFDASHAPVFEQIEGLVVDEGISFIDFKAGIDFFVKRFFTRDTAVRFRPSYFPFTEPSAEVDVQCQMCSGSGCSACKGTGWMEIMGSGMVHPAVFENCGVDPEKYTGYAFGMGPHRIAMLRYQLPDIRLLFGNDMRFLNQFVDDQ